MSPHRDVSDRATPRSRTANAARHSAKRSVTRRKQLRGAQVVGLTAALAAAASASTVGVGHGAPTSQATALGQNQIDALTTARIERGQLATRDAARVELSESVTRKLQASAAQQAKARDAKLAADRKLVQRRAAALAAAKAAATAKAQQAATAKAKQAAEAKAQRAAESEAAAEAKAGSASGAVLPTTGYRITATFGQQPLGPQPHRHRLRRPQRYAGPVRPGRRGDRRRVRRRLRPPGEGPAHRRHRDVVQPHVGILRLRW